MSEIPSGRPRFLADGQQVKVKGEAVSMPCDQWCEIVGISVFLGPTGPTDEEPEVFVRRLDCPQDGKVSIKLSDIIGLRLVAREDDAKHRMTIDLLFKYNGHEKGWSFY